MPGDFSIKTFAFKNIYGLKRLKYCKELPACQKMYIAGQTARTTECKG